MGMAEFWREVETAAAHRGGLKLRPCLALEPAWFAALEEDVRRLVATRSPSEVGDKSHPTHWTQPYGQATQYSLFNRSGDTADTSVDHNHRHDGKAFHAAEFAALRRLARCFEDRLLNLRLNGLLPGAGLSPHEEFVVHGDRLRLRFHLPVLTSPDASLLLDDERFRLSPGYIYYFNNGCVHGAQNAGGQPRYHLVFDMFLDEWVWEHVLDWTVPASPDPGLRKLAPEDARALVHVEPSPVDEYVIGTPSGVVLRARRQLGPDGEMVWVKTPIG